MQPTLATGFTLLARDPTQQGADGKGLLRRVAHLRQKSLSDRLGTLSAANPDEYGPAYSIPGESSWSIRASGPRAYGGDRLQLGAGLRALRRAKEGRRHAGVVLAYPNGSTREGRCIVEGLPVEGGGMRKPLEGSLQLSGVGALSREEGLRFWGDGASFAGGAWTDKSSYDHDTEGGQITEVDASGAFGALIFDGVDNHLQLPAGAVPLGNAPYTIAGVVRIDADANNTILAGGSAAAGEEIDVHALAGGVFAESWGGDLDSFATPGGGYELGEWLAFAVSYQTDLGRRIMLSTGARAQKRVEAAHGEPGRSGEPGPFLIGAENTGGQRESHLTGAIADLRIFGGALAPPLQHYTLTRLMRTYLR